MTEALVVNVILLGVFAIQHSVMTRPAFKRRWTQFVPTAVERSTYVLLSSLLLILLFCQGRSITDVIWSVTDNSGAAFDRLVLAGLGNRADEHLPNQPI